MKTEMKLKDLKLTEANRLIRRPHVDRLKEIIEKNGYLDGCPIICDEDGFIIDGQHRYVACKELNVEPPIIVLKMKNAFDMAPLMNSTQMSWGIRDYVHYWAVKGYPDYIIMEQICKAKDLSPSVVYNIVTGKAVERTGLGRASDRSELKTGAFKIGDTSEKGLAKLERKINAIMEIVNRLDLPRTDRLIIALARLASDKNFSFSTMLAKIDYQKAKVYRCSTIVEYQQMWANNYNYKNTKKIVV